MKIRYFIKSAITFLFLLHLSHVNIFSQRLAQDSWYKGFIQTTENEIINGSLKFELDKELIQIKTQEKVRTFSSRQIKGFSFYDDRLKGNRKYKSLAYQKNQRLDYESPVFFEVLTEGEKITLLAREKLEQNVYNYNPYRPFINYPSSRVAWDFYFLYPNGDIIAFNGNKKKLIKLFDNEKLSTYIKKNRFNISYPHDFIKIIDYYNAL